MLSPETFSLTMEEQFSHQTKRMMWEDLSRKEMVDELMFYVEQLMIRDKALVRNMKGNL